MERNLYSNPLPHFMLDWCGRRPKSHSVFQLQVKGIVQETPYSVIGQKGLVYETRSEMYTVECVYSFQGHVFFGHFNLGLCYFGQKYENMAFSVMGLVKEFSKVHIGLYGNGIERLIIWM